ncbi:hypothetical protein Hypma_006519 [Hypsizygus marmoreus]|uniref:Uncharacterized protein n=1 Tax=Hypsizygus marmoreus TaxID=39966 RepID=A0A369JYR9_HYPMA|nr:hypothetical protein Hypma_006519 [Hypsizygus marmoreus]
MSTADGSIYSPETAGSAAAEMAIAIRRQELQQLAIAWENQRQHDQAVLNEQQRQLESARAVVRQQEANNWLEVVRVREEKAAVELQSSIIQRDRDLLAKREQELQKLEDQRRRNRTASVTYIEDYFALLSPRAVVENLTHSSPKVRKHAMDNISSCVSGFNDAPPTFIRFTPQDIASDLLPKLHQLVSTSAKPLPAVVQFAELVVSAPPVAKALALNGQCSRLSDYLVENNEYASQLAICALRRMVGMETAIVKPAYAALSLAIPQIPGPESPNGPFHPAIDFVKEVTPKIIEDCFHNGLWTAIAPLVSHRISAIRQIVLHKIVLEAQHSDRTRNGLVEAHTLGLLDSQYQLPSPPPDVIAFFADLLPLLAEKMCRRVENISWLLARLSDPIAKINTSVIEAFRVCAAKQDPTILNIFVKANLLRRLNEPPTQQSFGVTKLICQLLPVLAIPYARAKAAKGIIFFLDHADDAVANACLTACLKIVDSTADDRAHLFSLVKKLSFAKENTLRLCDHAIPAFCCDWVALDDFAKIAKFIQHPQQRVRLPAQHAWHEVISNSQTARAKIVQDGLLNTIFELCSSEFADAVVIGARCCSPMAVEITKAGVSSTRQLVELLNHPNPLLRQAALRGIQVAAESSDAICKTLLAADTFNALKVYLEMHPTDLVENAHKILIRLAPSLSTSTEACAGILQLLESKSNLVASAARAALASISYTNITYRQTLRTVILNGLSHASKILIKFSAKAIEEWIGPDLAQLNDFTAFFSLASHSNKYIQTAALQSLAQKLPNGEYQESLEKANVVYLIRSLSSSSNSEAINFVVTALDALALSLARNEHVGLVLELLGSDEPKICEGAAAALEAIASGSMQERKQLLEENIIERLAGNQERLDNNTLRLLSSIIQKLAFDYLDAGKIAFFLTLVDHQQQQIRVAANKSLSVIAGGTVEQRGRFRDALLPSLEQSSALLREIAASCLSRSLAHDLVSDDNFIALFRLLDNADIQVREPAIVELRAHIQGSDEAERRRLVDAGILQAILQESNVTKNDLVTFLSSCVLPMLGPAFSQNNGGATIFPLLVHSEPRIRAAAISSLGNGVDSRHGSVKNMTDAGVVGQLHPLTKIDDAIRDLWCHVLPKAAPFLTIRPEVDILFENLNDEREIMRKAASEAINIMAKTSETTRLHLFPSLMHHLENPSPSAVLLTSQVVSLSGSAFIKHGKENELLHLIQDGIPELVIAAVEATTQLLSKGSSYEHQKLIDAEVFHVALELHSRPSQRQHSLKLLSSIISHLSYAIVQHEQLTRDLFTLFDDTDTNLSQTLYQTWTTDPRLCEGSVLPELLPILFEESKLRNSFVSGLLRYLAPTMVPQLVSRQRVDIIVKALVVKNAVVVRAFLEETYTAVKNATESEKEWFVTAKSFISVVGYYLRGHDVTMRRHSSAIVELLSKGSPQRSGRIMEEGIGSSLAWLAINGEKGAQQYSLDALYVLFLAAPDHAERLVTDSLPALCHILHHDDLSLVVYTSALRLLLEVARQSSHTTIIESGMAEHLVKWLSPRHSITDPECKQSVFHIGHLIAQSSDAGRKALIEEKILGALLELTKSRVASHVVHACQILKALAHSGSHRQDIVSAGLKDAMEHITSPFRKSSLEHKEDKKVAQAAAKEVLQTLRLAKDLRRRSTVGSASQAPRGLHHSFSTGVLVPHPAAQPLSADENGLLNSEAHPRRSQYRRTASESAAQFFPAREDMFGDISAESNYGSQSSHTVRHARSMTEPDRTANLRTRRVLSAVQEDHDVTSFQDFSPPPIEEELASQRPDSPGMDMDQASFNIRGPGTMGARTALPSYRTMPSVDGSVRPGSPGTDRGLDHLPSQRGAGIGGPYRLSPPSYRTAPSALARPQRSPAVRSD